MPMIGEGGERLPAEKKGEEKRLVLPADIQREILSRIPASSLLRFRPACKMWYEVTYDPAFIDLHVERAHLRKISGGTPHILCFYRRAVEHGYRFSTTILDERMTPIADISSRPIDTRCHIMLWCSGCSRFASRRVSYAMTPPCNGLVCVYTRAGDASLVNPMTGESLYLHPYDEPVERYYTNHECFLGYHPVTKEYKVLRFRVSGRGSTEEAFYEVVTLGTGIRRGRRIYDGDENFTFPYGDGISVNGVVYILNANDRKIGLFDLKDERFLTPIPFHDSISLNPWRDCRLLEVEEGNIGFVSIHENVLDIWMLKDVADSASWIHRYRVALHDEFRRAPIKPILIHQGELLVEWRMNLYCFGLNSDKESSRKVTNYDPFQHRCNFHAYEPSLISLNIRR